jgi:ribosome-associated translation inhibitor RaiA
MINVEIDAKGYDLDDGLRSRATDRIGGLDEFMSTLDKGRVTFSWEGGTNEQTKVYAKVWGGGEEFEASETDWKPQKALDQTRQKLESQIRRKHSKGLKDHDQHR